jgi:hypothetical protein
LSQGQVPLGSIEDAYYAYSGVNATQLGIPYEYPSNFMHFLIFVYVLCVKIDINMRFFWIFTIWIVYILMSYVFLICKMNAFTFTPIHLAFLLPITRLCVIPVYTIYIQIYIHICIQIYTHSCLYIFIHIHIYIILRMLRFMRLSFDLSWSCLSIQQNGKHFFPLHTDSLSIPP